MNRLLVVYVEAKRRRRIFVHCKESGPGPGKDGTSSWRRQGTTLVEELQPEGSTSVRNKKETVLFSKGNSVGNNLGTSDSPDHYPDHYPVHSDNFDNFDNSDNFDDFDEPGASGKSGKRTESFFVELLEQAFERKSVTCDDVREWRDSEFCGNVVHFLAIQNDVPGLLYVINLCGADPYLQRLRDGFTPLHLASMLSSRRDAAEFLQTLPGYRNQEFKDHEGRTVGECRRVAEAAMERQGTFVVFDLLLASSRESQEQEPLELACVVLDAEMQELARFSRCFHLSSISKIEEFPAEERVRLAKNRLLEDCFNPKVALFTQELEEKLLQFLTKYCPAQKSSAHGRSCHLVAWNPWKVQQFLERSMPTILTHLGHDWVSVSCFRDWVRSCSRNVPPASLYIVSKSRALQNSLLTVTYLQGLQDAVNLEPQPSAPSSSTRGETDVFSGGVAKWLKSKKFRDRKRTWQEWKEEKPCYIC